MSEFDAESASMAYTCPGCGASPYYTCHKPGVCIERVGMLMIAFTAGHTSGHDHGYAEGYGDAADVAVKRREDDKRRQREAFTSMVNVSDT